VRSRIFTAVNDATAPPLVRAEPNGLALRIISALVLAPIALTAAWVGGIAFTALVLVAAAGMGWEWARLTGCGEGALRVLVIAATTLPILIVVLTRSGIAVELVMLTAGTIWVLARLKGRPAPAWAALGAAWIALPCVALLWIGGDHEAGRAAVLWLFATVWATDTGAYVAGRGLGGPRLAPLISPNKTWAGFAGGLAASILVAWVTSRLTGAGLRAVVPAGLAMSAVAQVGDLAESLAKRRFGVKDSGYVIPGHGGVLDRLDGMLTAVMTLWVLTLASGASPLQWRV
jgi:phosphatidate cytidylyltransferase